MQTHQVVIVCGETGSGKTTQLPKIALSMGRGRVGAADGRGKRIGHTQPRRIAASSVAKRIAQELGTPLGDVVGYKVRFQDRVSRHSAIKLMTDGILLAETQTDPDLAAYDTLIIDEAHERSLNIDFLLGYLRQLLPRRPDLKVVVTSATIDAQRFADYFASRQGPAPVITVSGRMFAVEQRYRPFEESRDYGLYDAVADAVDELWRNPRDAGDVLVFLPGEREIREAADHVRHHLSHQPVFRNAEVLPLFARMGQAEQDRIFQPHTGLRIVLATNVAETSLTVPGIRYVVDAGTARVKRYSFRNKVEQLLIEPISQAAANQRAGRCGRVAEGVCIRLYDEQDFLGRAKFTDPEIMRSSLAAVILRMKALHLGPIEEFAFIESPPRRAIADGYQLLAELGAVDADNQLTPIGHALAKLPLDPRVGRMLLDAKQRNIVDDVLVIASALSVQDVRDRPMDRQAAADQAHAKFDDEKSEFVSYLRLWKWLIDSRGGHDGEHKVSNRQYENLLRDNFINIRRVREWRDIHSQLQAVVAEQGWRPAVAPAPKPRNATTTKQVEPRAAPAPLPQQTTPRPASYEQLHLTMLCGLLGNIGFKSDENPWYLGARGIKFYPHPGAKLKKKPGRWIVVSELVETTRLFGRGMANVEPQWIEQVAGHLLKKQVLDPHWEKKAAEVMAVERGTVYGLAVYQGRRVNFSRLEPVAARDIFIREALVAGNWDTKLPFLAANVQLIAQVQELEHKARRQDVLVDDAQIYAFYDAQLPPEVCSGASCERWYKEHVKKQPQALLLTREVLMRHAAQSVTAHAFPSVLRLGGVDCLASYLHEPGHPKDGVTVEVPLFALNQVQQERCDWLVPGMLQEKIHALLKTLHQKPRARLQPLAQTAERMAQALMDPEKFGVGNLMDVLLQLVRQTTSLDIARADMKLDMLAPHLLMHFCVVDGDKRQLGAGRDLAALKSDLGSQARGAFQALASLKVDKKPAPPQGSLTAASLARLAPLASLTSNQPGNPLLPGGSASPAVQPQVTAAQRYVAWTFGDFPELMEIAQGEQTLVGFPALIDFGTSVGMEVFDEPAIAATKHRLGLRRLFALQMKDVLKHLEKNLPELTQAATMYMLVGRTGESSGGGTLEELREQVMQVALERAFLQEPLPRSEADFKKRLDDGRGRLTLIAMEVARLAAGILYEYATVQRKIKDTKQATEAVADVKQQLQRLVPKFFLTQTPYGQLQHFKRYLQAMTLRLDKWRADPGRDASRLLELKPQEQKYLRLVAERRGVVDGRLNELRWLLEELRVSFFAQELRTPQPISIKRLEKFWAQLDS